MSDALARLQSLRRQAGAAPRPVSAGNPSLPLSLRRTQALRQRGATFHSDRALPGSEIARGLRLLEHSIAIDEPPAKLLCGAFDRGEPISATDVLFFDTETTGLAGGTGTRAFMIGVSAWSEDRQRLHVRQLLMTELRAESDMLATFESWMTPSTVLCSYNGKCYDAPLLRTRFRLARRTAERFTSLRHVDLLYPTRRRYRGIYENCRLATIERQVLQIVREDDLPGSEAPAAWLGYLRGGSAYNLRRVAQHNFQDVVTLARLLPHLSLAGSGILTGSPPSGC